MLSLNQRHEMGMTYEPNTVLWSLWPDSLNSILRPLNRKLHQYLGIQNRVSFNRVLLIHESDQKFLSKRCTMREKNFATIYITKRALLDYLYVSSREVWKLFWACLIALSTRLLAALKRQNPNDIIEAHLCLSVSTLNPKIHSYFWIHMINA